MSGATEDRIRFFQPSAVLFCELVWLTTYHLALTVDREALAGQKFDELTRLKGGIL